MASVMRQFQDSSYLFGGNAAFIEDLYEKYLVNPQSVPEEWREYFDRLQVLPGSTVKDIARAPVEQSFVQRAKRGELGGAARTLPTEPVAPERLQVAALLLVTAYRISGSRWATVDPLKRMPRPSQPELEPGFYDLTEADLDQTVNAGSYVGLDRTSLRNLLQALRDTYCRNIGYEYMFISDRVQRQWIQERSEPVRGMPKLTSQQQKHLLQKLTEAEHLERYLHTKYVGQKRFSLEGGESVIPCIDELIQRAGGTGVQEIVIGMAHRGRLNVLVNVLGKMPKDLFLEFEGKAPSELPSGDVKYHNGFSSDLTTSGGPVHISLAFNPSHLEIVNPVVEGSVRARQRRRDDKTGDQVLPILIHGDAAFAAQGVVMETLNLSGTRGYGTGGTVHIIVNNQIGFTTSDPRDARSTLYCTDVAKMVEAPIFHVNGDDPEARQVPQGRGDRHRLLQEARPQRAGRAVHHAATHVQEDQPAPGHAQALCGQAGDAGRGKRGGAGGNDQALPRYAGCGPADGEPGALQLQEQVRGGLGAVPQLEVDRRRGYPRAARGATAPGRAADHGARGL